MKKIYEAPATELFQVKHQHLLEGTFYSNTESANGNDPNNGNTGPGVENEGGDGEMARYSTATYTWLWEEE